MLQETRARCWKIRSGTVPPSRCTLILRRIAITFIIFLAIPVEAKDINLDEIYIRRSSPLLKKLIFQKLDTYEKLGANFVDRDVIFSGWRSGDQIVYIKEVSENLNIAYRYWFRRNRGKEICRVSGIITYCRLTPNGRYLIIKRLIQREGIIPRGERVLIDIESNKRSVVKTRSPFADFSLSVNGALLLYESRRGIVVRKLNSGMEQLLLRRKRYADITTSKNPSIAYISPNQRKILVINGGGGIYRGKLINRGSRRVYGISSATEIFWVNNRFIFFRRGSVGNYSAILYDTNRRRKKVLIRNSLNTNLFYSYHAKILSLLKDQIIILYFITQKRLVNTGVEGEDISFDPGGRFFTSLLCRKLFVLNLQNVIRRRIELRRTWSSLLHLYQQLRGRSEHFENEFSGYYIKRKVTMYRKLLHED